MAARAHARPAAKSACSPPATSSAVRHRKEAEDYYEHYAVRMGGDCERGDFYMGAKEKFSSSHDPEAYRLHRKRFVGGAGTYPLIGTPHMIAEEMVRMSDVGFAGTDRCRS